MRQVIYNITKKNGGIDTKAMGQIDPMSDRKQVFAKSEKIKCINVTKYLISFLSVILKKINNNKSNIFIYL